MHSASKKDKCSGVIKQATPILKQLYQSQNDAIKVRALVVSRGTDDASTGASFLRKVTLRLLATPVMRCRAISRISRFGISLIFTVAASSNYKICTQSR